ncbi:hypothetical protein WJX84_001635 [Apatococcus fuscideae]|uniref:AAA+ ATPase domain-containing protein n=1 Tax=Apatococcus fuscideae TaxID=2026836 RepID=A0AAW1SWH2_9CHLO
MARQEPGLSIPHRLTGCAESQPEASSSNRHSGHAQSASGGASSQQPGRHHQQPALRRASYTGIDLAAKASGVMEEEEEMAGAHTEDEEEFAEAAKRIGTDLDRQLMAKPKKGKKTDPMQSLVPDPTDIPWDEKADPDRHKELAQTIWRPDKLGELTYTQFWRLITERKIEKVRNTFDRRSVWVTTKANAPGGKRTEKVGLPYDPDLFDHMVEHGVYIEDGPENPWINIGISVLRLGLPLGFAVVMMNIVFGITLTQAKDPVWEGAKMDLINQKDADTSFADIAGIDTVKEEILEVIEFLRNPKRFLDLGARSPAGILLVGPPGTGKTLLAKAVAGEAGVPFYSVAGTEFMEVFVGVGASRVRNMFVRARADAPCILFIDEFDGIGRQRSATSVGDEDESVHTINQLLTEMDGFEDNTGVVVIAATNRPATLDTALTRPGRFDRVITLPLPNLEGRAEILKVHSRDKRLAEDVDLRRVARATAGSTGADLMNLMNQSAILAVRAGRNAILEPDILQALDNIRREGLSSGGMYQEYDDEVVPQALKRQVSVYEAGRALLAFITPGYDEISKVSACEGNVPSGFTYLIPSEERLEAKIITRGYMESKLVVCMAGRCAEKLVLGAGNVSTAGSGDIETANYIAREMIFRCGFSKRLGPVALMDNNQEFINRDGTHALSNMSTEIAAIATQEIQELLQAAEAKAYYGLAVNYKALEALVRTLTEDTSISGAQLQSLMQDNSIQFFPDAFTEGFTFDDDGILQYPGAPGTEEELEQLEAETLGLVTDAAGKQPPPKNGRTLADVWHPYNPYRARLDINPDFLSTEQESGRIRH